MKLRFQNLFRFYIFALAALLLWSVWRATAQTNGAVEITSPRTGEHFRPGTNILLRADSSLSNVTRVEFLADREIVAAASNAPYALVWSNVPAGTHRLTARAVPEQGGPVESAEVEVRVYSSFVTLGLDRMGILDSVRPFGIPLWQYIAALLYIFLAFYISKFLDYLTRVWLKRLATRTESKLDDLLLDLLNGPVKIIAFILLLRIGLEVFSWPAIVQKILAKGFTIAVAVTATYTVIKFVDLMMGYWRRRTAPGADAAFDEQLYPIIRKSLRVFVIVVAALVTLDNIGVNITAAIASLSIGGLAVGLAAQDTLGNLFGAIAIFADRPFRLGDMVKIDDAIQGTVESIGLRSTRLRHPEGFLITVPNKNMGNANIVNINRRPTIRTEMNIGLTHDTPVDKVKLALKIVEDIYKNHKETHDILMGLNKFTDSTVNIWMLHWWKGNDYRAYLAGIQEMNLKLKERFDAEGIRFAFPTKTLYVKQDSDWRLGQK